MMRGGIVILIFAFGACSIPNNKKSDIYYVIQHTKINNEEFKDVPPPPPPDAYYGDYNFVLLDTTTIYYHRKHIYDYCGTGLENKPPIISLTLADLTQIRMENLTKFLSASECDTFRFISISYPTDTIRNKAVEIITDFFKSKNYSSYRIRNFTEEERNVLDKKN